MNYKLVKINVKPTPQSKVQRIPTKNKERNTYQYIKKRKNTHNTEINKGEIKIPGFGYNGEKKIYQNLNKIRERERPHLDMVFVIHLHDRVGKEIILRIQVLSLTSCPVHILLPPSKVLIIIHQTQYQLNPIPPSLRHHKIQPLHNQKEKQSTHNEQVKKEKENKNNN